MDEEAKTESADNVFSPQTHQKRVSVSNQNAIPPKASRIQKSQTVPVRSQSVTKKASKASKSPKVMRIRAQTVSPRPKNSGLSKKTMSVQEFKDVPLRQLFEDDDALKDNYDIAKKICKFYDGQFGDTDTVCMVAERGKQPAMSYWVKGEYVRKHRDIAGKHIIAWRR